MTAPGPVRQRPAGRSPFAGIARIRSLGVAVQPLSCPRPLSLSSRLRVSPALVRSSSLDHLATRCMGPVTAPRAESPACTGRTSCFSEARGLAGRRRSCFQVWPQGHSLAVAVGRPCREPVVLRRLPAGHAAGRRNSAMCWGTTCGTGERRFRPTSAEASAGLFHCQGSGTVIIRAARSGRLGLTGAPSVLLFRHLEDSGYNVPYGQAIDPSKFSPNRRNRFASSALPCLSSCEASNGAVTRSPTLTRARSLSSSPRLASRSASRKAATRRRRQPGRAGSVQPRRGGPARLWPA